MPLRPDMEFREYLALFKRRRWLVVFSFLAIFFAAIVYCVVVSEQYKSTTTILIIPQSVPENYVRSTVSLRVEEQLATIKQQVLSRTSLIKVMDEIGLFAEERKRRPVEEVVEMMRRRIEIVVVEGRSPVSSEAFSLSFVHEDRRSAMLAASRLASFFIDENLKTREQQAVGTSEFLESQLRDTKVKLEAQEARVKDYKMKYMGELPQQMEANLRMLTGLQDRLRSIGDAQRTAQDRRVLLEAQIGFLERPVGAAPGDNTQHVASGGSDSLQGLMRELAARRTRLSELTARYTERYPEIPRLRQEIADLEKRIFDARQLISAGSDDAQRGVALAASGASGTEIDELRRMKAQVESTTLEISSLRKERDEITKNIAKAEEKIERSPRREQEMISLLRDYDNLKRSYDGLLQKKLEADVAQNLEKRQKGTQFQILDPANLPEEPFKPDRRKVMGVALVLALGLGFGGTLGLEMIDPTLRSKTDFKHYFQVPVLACIPVIQDGHYKRNRTFMKVAVLSGLVSFAAAFLVFLLVYGGKIRSILKF